MNLGQTNVGKEKTGRQRQKYVPLFTHDGTQEFMVLPGRHMCLCQASKHRLINNCLNCGRIVCEQEGSGPCFTCKNLVCTKEEQEVLNRNSKSSAKLLQKLMGENTLKPLNVNQTDKDKYSLTAAIDHKNKLLEYDKTVSKRTKVIDDESDYFEVDSNKWLSKEEREIISQKQNELYESRHASRRSQKLSFDFAGRQIIEEKSDLDYDFEELLKSDTSVFDCQDFSSNLIYDMSFNPEYLGDKTPKRHSLPEQSDLTGKINLMKIQDRELQEMSDEGMCLSLHQPFASLLVAGIKKHEGRAWYTCYRGRLWIHSASKIPTRQEITAEEAVYRFNKGDIHFPDSYPSGCLLGCVTLVDCFPQEEYREKYPEGESASPYVFICEDHQELPIKFPMKGKHKIFKLDNKFHQAAKKTLKKSEVV